MVWFKLDDRWHSHRKVIPLSLEARGLWATLGSWCAEQLNGGHVPQDVCKHFGGKRGVKLALELIGAGLWSKVSDGYQFHDWNDHNPTKDAVLAKREATLARVHRHRNAVTEALQTKCNGVSNAAPDPDPDPDPKERERALSKFQIVKEPEPLETENAWVRLGKLYQQLYDAEQEGSRSPRPYDQSRILSSDANQFLRLIKLVEAEAARTGVGARQLFTAAAQAFLRDGRQREKGLVLEFFARDFALYVDRSLEAAS